MERKVSATDARIHLGELMRWTVERQKPVVVERSGKPYVVVLSVRAYERLKAAGEQEEDWRQLVQRSRERIRSELGDRELPAAEELLRKAREERDAQLADLR